MCNDCKAMVFDLGRVVLGDNSGGIVNKLIKLHGIRSASKILKLAHGASDPMEYIGGVLRKTKVADDAQEGEVIGRYIRHNGAWRLNEAAEA